MNDAGPMLKQLNRTFIGSVLFIDIVGYSTRTVPDQLEMKEVFNAMLADAVQNVAPNERIMVDTGDGAGIAFLGDPEDALFAALSLRDAIETMGVGVGEPGFVRMGINLGPLKIVRDINGHTNMIGDGVNDAQRVMSFSEPGQVMVSHSYYDIISRFSRDYTQLFVYEGMRQDKHVREHEVYRFGPLKDNESLTEKLRDRSRARHTVHHEPVPDVVSISATATGKPAGAKSVAAHGQEHRQGQEQAPAAARRMSRTGMIAAGVGALSLVGAVWSWTSAPKEPQEKAAAMAVMAEAAPASAETPSQTGPAATANVKADAAAAVAKPQAVPAAAAASVTASSPVPPVAAAAPASDSANAAAAAADKTARPAEPAPPPKPGTIHLAIQPWGEIYVDGAKRGISPPIKSISLAPGKHRIEVRNGDFAPYKETIEVKAGGESTVQFVF